MIPNSKALVCIGLLVITGTLKAQTFINACPFVITSPGDYLLAANLICGGGDGITINTGNVRLALEGHTITAGVGAGNAIVIRGLIGAPVAHVRILGPGLITNGGGNAFSAGVLFFGSPALVTQSEVNGITVLGCGFGIEANAAGAGNASIPLTGLTFTANTLGRNSTGIMATEVDSSTISKNDVSGNGVGIAILNTSILLTGPPLVVSHNIVNGNTGGGVLLSPGAFLNHTVTVQNNVISGNGTNGITNNGIALEITNNTSLANGMFDLFDADVLPPGCFPGTVYSGNTFFTANKSCIH